MLNLREYEATDFCASMNFPCPVRCQACQEKILAETFRGSISLRRMEVSTGGGKCACSGKENALRSFLPMVNSAVEEPRYKQPSPFETPWNGGTKGTRLKRWPASLPYGINRGSWASGVRSRLKRPMTTFTPTLFGLLNGPMVRVSEKPAVFLSTNMAKMKHTNARCRPVPVG